MWIISQKTTSSLSATFGVLGYFYVWILTSEIPDYQEQINHYIQ